MSASAYRSLDPVFSERVAELRARRAGDAPFVDLARRVAVRRIGRTIGGAVGVVVGSAAMLVGVASFFAGYPLERREQAVATELLLLAWPLAIAAAVAARLLARAAVVSAEGALLPLTGVPSTDFARLEAHDPLRRTRALATRWETASIALPMAALAMIAPLSLHCVAWCLLSGAQGEWWVDFGQWIAISAVVVGHAHVALAIAAAVWARRTRLLDAPEVRARIGRSWGVALLVAIGVSCLPGVLLLAVPPILVGMTGIVFVPAMYVVAAGWITSERMALGGE